MASILKEKYLYERYSARLLAVCQRYLGSRADAEDVLHDSFIAIFKKIDDAEYRGEGKLYAWMRTVTVHQCIDFIRRKKRAPGSLDERMDFVDDAGPEPEGVRKIPPDVLFRLIRELPEGYRTVFNLFSLDGYSHAEIAEMLGIKEKTSSSQYLRARRLLAQKINDYLAHDGKKQ